MLRLVRRVHVKPPPLPQAQQREFEKLVKNFNEKHTTHPDAQPKPKPFEQDRNPETGEIGGPKGKEPTRYGDWERNGRVFDF